MVSPKAVLVVIIALAAQAVSLSQTVDLGTEDPTTAVEKASIHGGNIPTSSTTEAPASTPLLPARRGDILMAKKMYREAIETYGEGIRDAAILYNKIGIAYHQLSDFDAAMRNYNMALRLNPTYAEAINNIGTVFYAQKKLRPAIKQYQKALEYAPRSASIYSNLGTAYFSRKKYNDAFAAYQKALELDPTVFENSSATGSLLQERSVAERAKFHFYLAKTYAKAGLLDRALIHVRRALEEGFSDKNKFRKDPEFAKLQDNEEFLALLAAEYRVL
jgi:tetratricopeptide (TPR) repeat protein